MDLEALGIGPLDHGKKIYEAMQNTKAQVRIIGHINFFKKCQTRY